MLLCRTGPLPRKTDRTWAAESKPCCRLRRPLPLCSDSQCPAAAQGQHCSIRFHPKLPGLTEVENKSFKDIKRLVLEKRKAGKGLPTNAGLGILPRAGKDFVGLIYSLFNYFFKGVHEVAALSFWLLLDQAIRRSPLKYL